MLLSICPRLALGNFVVNNITLILISISILGDAHREHTFLGAIGIRYYLPVIFCMFGDAKYLFEMIVAAVQSHMFLFALRQEVLHSDWVRNSSVPNWRFLAVLRTVGK